MRIPRQQTNVKLAIGRFLLLVASFARIVEAQSSPASPSPPPLPESMIEQIKKAVVFLQGSYLSKQTRSVNGLSQQIVVPTPLTGTGFLIFLLDPRLGPDRGETFLVTNKHMIREPGESGVLGEGPYFSSVLMRINTKQVGADGNQFALIPLTVVDKQGSLDWFIDPDETVDLAIAPVVFDTEKEPDYKTIQTSLFATKELVKREHVNENDEILFTGLFTWSPGAKKNYPIVRHGKLARLLEERIPLDRNHPEKTVEVHLAEVMSFGGNSGSPVFLRIGGLRETEGSPSLMGYSYYLLGVMQGFFPEGMDFAIEIAELKGSAAQNSGLAAVIPADKILEILDSPRCRAFREIVAAVSFSEKGNIVEAESAFKNGINLLEKSTPDHTQLAAALETYADFLRKANRASEANGRFSAGGGRPFLLPFSFRGYPYVEKECPVSTQYQIPRRPAEENGIRP